MDLGFGPTVDARLVDRFGGLRRSSILGVVLGVLYGVVARLVFEGHLFFEAFFLVSLSFLVLVPAVIGYLTVYPAERPTWSHRIVRPWLPTTLAVAAAWLVGWEGAICVYMSAPLLLVLSSLGGIAAGAHKRRRAGHVMIVALVPFVVAPLERQLSPPVDIERNVTQTIVEAPPATVWEEVAEVPTITDDEQREALYTRMGFPRPVSAELVAPGVGGVRHARFEGGVLFVETITAWDPGRRIAFSIDPRTDSIPATTLDPHVTIGGEVFDVLSGEYTLHRVGNDRTRLELTSRHRLSTTLNPYAGWWARLVMRSIQRNILQIVRVRAERASGALGATPSS